MNELVKGVRVMTHSAIRIERAGKVLYFDPFSLVEEPKDADMILITHEHFDHFSPEDIAKVRKAETRIVVPEKLEKAVLELGFSPDAVTTAAAGDVCELDGVRVEAVASYNVNKQFHPKSEKNVGYVVTLDGIRYFVAGDTDANEENKKVRCDVALLPAGGKYTMDAKEAAELAAAIAPKVAVPTHYGTVVGTKDDCAAFCAALKDGIACECLMEFHD